MAWTMVGVQALFFSRPSRRACLALRARLALALACLKNAKNNACSASYRVDSQQLMRATTYSRSANRGWRGIGVAMPSRCRSSVKNSICRPWGLKKYSFPGASQTLLRMYEPLVLLYPDYCSEPLEMRGEKPMWQTPEITSGAGRIITFSDYNTRSVDKFQYFEWDTLEQRSSKWLAISVFKSLNNLYPEGLKNMFKPTSWVHPYNVRSSSNNVLYPGPILKLSAKRAFSYRGLSCWMAFHCIHCGRLPFSVGLKELVLEMGQLAVVHSCVLCSGSACLSV